jgi:recombination protein RecA
MSINNFRKAMDKKRDKFHMGFAPISDWISTGNAALNEIISGDMRRGFPVSRMSIISGFQGSGKSFLIANYLKNAQEKGYFTIFLDTEYSVGEGFMEKIGVDTSEDKFMVVNVHTIEETIEFMSEFFKNVDKDEKVAIGLDSLSNLIPEGDDKKFDEGRVAYSQGLPQKMIKQAVAGISSKIGNRNTCFVTTSHLYVAGADRMGNQIVKPNVGEGTLYLPSVGIELQQVPLKEKTELIGISVRCKTFKTRYNQKGKKCEFALPWDRGMDFLDGALKVIEEAGVVERNGAWYKYINKETGEEVKFQSSSFPKHADILMEYYGENVGEVVEKEEVSANLEMIRDGDEEDDNLS